MELKINAGKRVLYKNGGSSWLIGALKEGNAEVSPSGLFLPIIPKAYLGQTEPEEIDWAEINNIFLDAVEVEKYLKDYNDIFMPKEKYIEIVERDDESFVKALEQAYVSDGEYYYYPITKFTRNWIEKQPFDYVVRFSN